ncbi:HAMP domain-containing histidine kinase [Dactylosporangium aurantiacum]|uniref:histidine kinase n=1 Tax=Dactylosporangium aurantiacum TaxID=35754 RepID=A0A9Q9MFT8_9ACTN|nr:HAMP domain-containing sensor histidine kinase [Dactylosporangium aurantiacum]MDG6102767.1 HAMP domain-containing sensor histidine kinase [Dactylosporangium aurantiacum]UWZ52990.1 HAMP domain-containing histidine kinase [Dactylosporangium aurantiacum]
MRVRLVTTYLLLLLLVLAALEVPLALSIAGRDTQRLVADRLADVTRFATLAEPALRAGETGQLHAELQRYDEVYGIAAIVVDQDANPLVSSRDGLTVGAADSAVRRQALRALEGREASDDGTIWPWRLDPFVVAVPVGRGGEVIGAVVTISPTGRRVASVRTAWSVLAGGGLVVLFAGIAAAWSLARWTLRPVAELDAAAHELGAGDYAARVPAADGPPELRRLGAAFNDMAATVADSLERQRAFVSHASHQLRNPLTALRLRVEDIGVDLTDPQAVEGHRLALEEAERLGDVLDSLLTLARAERGSYDLADVDAGEVAWARVVAWQPVAAKRDITLRYVRPPRPLRARAVTTALDQALDALIDNAVKFSGAGGTVTVRPAADDGGVAVHVLDTGPGLTEQQRELATERFWRAPDAQNVDGSGLGLPIVAVLVEASAGRLDLLPNEPTGLHARVWLPSP